MGFNSPSLSSMVSRLADPNDQGGILGLASSLASLGRVVGPAWGGYLYDAYGMTHAVPERGDADADRVCRVVDRPAIERATSGATRRRRSMKPMFLHAANPGPMTGDGNWTYLIGDRHPVLIDAGVGDAVASRRHCAAPRRRALPWSSSRTPTAITCPARRRSTSGGRRRVSQSIPWPIRDPKLPWFRASTTVRSSQQMRATLTVLHTPGHAPDHLTLVARGLTNAVRWRHAGAGQHRGDSGVAWRQPVGVFAVARADAAAQSRARAARAWARDRGSVDADRIDTSSIARSGSAGARRRSTRRRIDGRRHRRDDLPDAVRCAVPMARESVLAHLHEARKRWPRVAPRRSLGHRPLAAYTQRLHGAQRSASREQHSCSSTPSLSIATGQRLVRARRRRTDRSRRWPTPASTFWLARQSRGQVRVFWNLNAIHGADVGHRPGGVDLLSTSSAAACPVDLADRSALLCLEHSARGGALRTPRARSPTLAVRHRPARPGPDRAVRGVRLHLLRRHDRGHRRPRRTLYNANFRNC